MEAAYIEDESISTPIMEDPQPEPTKTLTTDIQPTPTQTSTIQTANTQTTTTPTTQTTTTTTQTTNQTKPAERNDIKS